MGGVFGWVWVLVVGSIGWQIARATPTASHDRPPSRRSLLASAFVCVCGQVVVCLFAYMENFGFC